MCIVVEVLEALAPAMGEFVLRFGQWNRYAAGEGDEWGEQDRQGDPRFFAN